MLPDLTKRYEFTFGQSTGYYEINFVKDSRETEKHRPYEAEVVTKQLQPNSISTSFQYIC